MHKIVLSLAAAVVASLALTAVASADTITTDFETFSLGSVNGQQGWHSADPGDLPETPNGYDQEVVAPPVPPPGFGQQSLRHSNGYANGEFQHQTYSASNVDNAGEDLTNKVFVGEFDFYGAQEQQGLVMKMSPDDGVGGRMSFVRLEDQPDGIHATFFDTDADGTFHSYGAGVYSYGAVHHVKFSIRFVDGPDNDVVRLIIDGTDIGDSLGECFTTWENYYRAAPPKGEGEEPPVTNSIEFRADFPFTLDGNPATDGVPSLVGGGYLFDNVVTSTSTEGGPAPTQCGAQGAFCSPGYWKNAPQAAWDKVAPITKQSLFNSVVVPDFYANSIPSNPKLIDVLSAKSATKYGKPAGPFGLDPYNAVGAALTSKLPGYVFDAATIGLATACPLDGRGNWKPGAGPTS
jgi:hypothetical protein